MSDESGQPGVIAGGRLWVPLEAVSITVSRSSGPGGQNVNKVNTRVELHVPVAAIHGLTPPMRQKLESLAGRRLVRDEELRLVSQQTRSQEQNRAEALAQLAELLTAASDIPPTRRPTRPTRGSKRRRLEGKKHRGETKARRSGEPDA